jgi:hypothetical protein
MEKDPILREVYRIKDELNREIGGDVEKLFERLRKFAEEHPERMVQPVPKVAQQTERQPTDQKRAK